MENMKKTSQIMQKKDAKKVWQYIRSKLKTNNPIPDLKTGTNEKTNSDEEKAEVLLKFFSSVFTIKEDGEIPKPTHIDVEKMANIEIGIEEVKKRLKDLNENKSPGPDGIHPKIYKELNNTLAHPLHILFNETLRAGKIPDQWRTAFITAIHK